MQQGFVFGDGDSEPIGWFGNNAMDSFLFAIDLDCCVTGNAHDFFDAWRGTAELVPVINYVSFSGNKPSVHAHISVSKLCETRHYSSLFITIIRDYPLYVRGVTYVRCPEK